MESDGIRVTFGLLYATGSLAVRKSTTDNAL